MASSARRSSRAPAAGVLAVLVTVLVAVAVAVPGAVAVPVAVPVAAGSTTASDMTVVDVTVTPQADDLADGYATLTLDLALRSVSGLPDSLSGPTVEASDTVVARRVHGPGSTWLPGETPVTAMVWQTLTRVSGTPQDGVWRAEALVSPVLSGRWLVTDVRDFGGDHDFVDVAGQGAVFELGPETGPVIAVQPAPLAPVRVVTGRESWTPRARITDRSTGAGVRGAYLDFNVYGSYPPSPREAALPRADAQGYVRLRTVPVVYDDGEGSRSYLLAYASRGSRGFSWESATGLWPLVKWQANQRYTVSGRDVTATGNAWPAPAIYRAANPRVQLQHLVGRTWRTVATARVRDNGRYTLPWVAPGAGTHLLRVYKPGGADGSSRHSVGTVLSTVPVTTR